MYMEINIHAVNGDQRKCLGAFRLNARTIQEVLATIFGASAHQPVSKDTSEEQEQPHADNQQPAEPAETIAYDYKVRSVKPSGQNSLFLELVDKGGKVTAAYIKAGEQTITAGSCLNNVDIQRKNSNYGEYNLINACQVAA